MRRSCGSTARCTGGTGGSTGASAASSTPAIAATSPGSTSIPTPFLPLAVRMASASTMGTWRGRLVSSQYATHSRKKKVGCVSCR